MSLLSGHKDIVICSRLCLDKTKQFIIYHILISSTTPLSALQGEWNIHGTSKLFDVQLIIKRSFTPMEQRRHDVALCRARIGHAYCTNGYLLREELRPMCCNTLTVRHILLSCAKYAKDFLFRDTPIGFIIQFLRECNL